jgi:hypothetical protein
VKNAIEAALHKPGALVQQRSSENLDTRVSCEVWRCGELISQHHLGQTLASQFAFGEQCARQPRTQEACAPRDQQFHGIFLCEVEAI